MRYLVLGSAGQIGKPLCVFLRSVGGTVVEFDIEDDTSNDLRIPHVLNDILERVDFVFFLASDIGGARYLKNYQGTFAFLNNNISILKNTFESLYKSKTPFIFTSSQMSNMHYSTYGMCKNIGERYTELLGGLTVKFWNVYGQEHDEEKFHVITDFILKAKQGEIKTMTDGTEVRQFLHVDDCCKALYKLSQLYDTLPRDKEYHITNFEWTSIRNIAEIITDYIPASISYSDQKDDVQKNKQNEPDPYILNYWEPTIDVIAGIKQVILLMNQ